VAALVLGIEVVQLLQGRRTLVVGDRAVLFLQPGDEFLEPVPVALEAQRFGDVSRQPPLGRLRADLVKEILGPPIRATPKPPSSTSGPAGQRG
jgi:hypothetical protein